MKKTLNNYRIWVSRFFLLFVLILILFSKINNQIFEHYHIFLFIHFAGILLVGIGALGRVWCGSYIVGQKNKALIQIGPYSMCRNPLYFFSFSALLGLGLLTNSILVTILLVLAFALYYPFVIYNEEKKLNILFPNEYPNYKKITPRFFPKFQLVSEPEIHEVNSKKFKKALYDNIWFIWAIAGLHLIDQIKIFGIIPIYFNLW